MKPYKITIYLYAENDEQAAAAEKAAKDFVKAKYERGILVTAEKFVGALTRFKDNIMVNQFLK